MSPDILVVDARDNVATALRPLEQGESLQIEVGDRTIQVTVLEPIAFGHKIALADLEPGERVLKYGEVIGLATQRIAQGEHVHVHNVKGPETGREGSIRFRRPTENAESQKATSVPTPFSFASR